jgi:hypothetical protein
LALGCGNSSDQATDGDAAAVVQVSTKNLPALAEYLPPLDDGRIQLAGPRGWRPVPRSSKFLARFKRTKDEQYPTIIVTAQDSQSVGDVERGNVEKFAARLAKETGAKNVSPLVIGDFVGAAYRKYGKEQGKTSQVLDRLLLVTVVDGREYTLELRARDGELDESRERLFAVAHGAKFLKAASLAPEPGDATDTITAEAGTDLPERPVEQAADSGQDTEGRAGPRQDTIEPTDEAEQPTAREKAEEPTLEPKEESKPSAKAGGKIDLDKELEGLLDP